MKNVWAIEFARVRRILGFVVLLHLMHEIRIAIDVVIATFYMQLFAALKNSFLTL